MKKKGIILPIFSLPSKFGIGDFGNEAYEFIDILSSNNIDYWEILPINACHKLPYSPISYYALNEEYISLEKLKEKGLIKNPRERKIGNRAQYDNYKEKYYLEAYSNFTIDDGYVQFIKCKEINKYAEYMCNLTGFGKDYYLFLQYVLYNQWMDIKNYANSKNVEIIGDMPIYPAFNSVETAYNLKYFQTEDGKFKFEAGTPPDFYSETGQKWNTPVYNIEEIKKDNYSYFVKRYEYYLKLFNKVRIDHFRGYDSFYKIPIGELGTQGHYEDGLGYGFFNELFSDKNVNPACFIVEDLGDIRKETIELRDYYGFTGQKMIQTSIDLENMRDNYNINDNIMVLPGNHDSHTICSWYKEMNYESKNKLKDFLRENNCMEDDINIAMIEYCFKSKSKIVMVTVQDIIGLDDTARINVPGTDSYKNWTWKLENFTELKNKIQMFKNIENV